MGGAVCKALEGDGSELLKVTKGRKKDLGLRTWEQRVVCYPVRQERSCIYQEGCLRGRSSSWSVPGQGKTEENQRTLGLMTE